MKKLSLLLMLVLTGLNAVNAGTITFKNTSACPVVFYSGSGDFPPIPSPPLFFSFSGQLVVHSGQTVVFNDGITPLSTLPGFSTNTTNSNLFPSAVLEVVKVIGPDGSQFGVGNPALGYNPANSGQCGLSTYHAVWSITLPNNDVTVLMQ